MTTADRSRPGVPDFHAPQINLYSRDLPTALAFYRALGFAETFRGTAGDTPRHVEMRLDGFTLGIATLDAAAQDHGLAIAGDGRGIEIVLWTDDVDAAFARVVAGGARSLSRPHDFLDGRLRAAWVADPDGNPIQLVARRAR